LLTGSDELHLSNMDVAISKAGVPIRLTDERWYHIVENHDDLAGYYDEVLLTVEDPDFILRGYSGALIAVRSLGRRKFLSVIYRELTRKDGFIITAYFATQISRNLILWRKEQQ
jgi:hypothetical protein